MSKSHKYSRDDTSSEEYPDSDTETYSDTSDDTDSDQEFVYVPIKVNLDDSHQDKLIEKTKKDLLRDLVKNGLLKTCKMCGSYENKYAYKTRLCIECHRVYSHNVYMKRKAGLQTKDEPIKDIVK